jgi:hypothetical protein
MCPTTGYEGVARSGAPTGKRREAVRVWLLGGFRVSVGSRTLEEVSMNIQECSSVNIEKCRSKDDLSAPQSLA